MGFFTLKKSQAATDLIQFTEVLDNIREDRVFLLQVLFQSSQLLADLAFLKHHFRSSGKTKHFKQADNLIFTKILVVFNPNFEQKNNQVNFSKVRDVV
jgi:hypothetical protein